MLPLGSSLLSHKKGKKTQNQTKLKPNNKQKNPDSKVVVKVQVIPVLLQKKFVIAVARYMYIYIYIKKKTLQSHVEGWQREQYTPITHVKCRLYQCNPDDISDYCAPFDNFILFSYEVHMGSFSKPPLPPRVSMPWEDWWNEKLIMVPFILRLPVKCQKVLG